MEDWDRLLRLLLQHENPLCVGGVTFTTLGVLGDSYDVPVAQWDHDAIADDMIAKGKQYGILKQ